MPLTSSTSKRYLQASRRAFLEDTSQRTHIMSKSRSKSRGASRPKTTSLYKSAHNKTTIKAYHLSNCIYQGQVKAFDRVGKGMIIHDNGLTGIIRSGSNRLKDHNIFFSQNIILSVIQKEHQVDYVYKNGNKILVLNFEKQQNCILIKSPGYLIELDMHKVSKLKYKNNVLIQKILMNAKQTQEIIVEQRFSKIMRQQHIQALKFNIFDQSFPLIDIMKKSTYQYHIGFTQLQASQYSTTYNLSYPTVNNPNKKLQGLGMIIQKFNYDPTKQFRYQFRILQQGFYSNGVLQYFGQQYYQNGNFYCGGIKDQLMNGYGILVYPKQHKFVYGYFQNGKPIELDQNPLYRLNTQAGINIFKNLKKKLHYQDPQLWIDSYIRDAPDQNYFYQVLQQALRFVHEEQSVKDYIALLQQSKLTQKVDNFRGSRIGSRISRTSDRMQSHIQQKQQKTGFNKTALPDLNILEDRSLSNQIKRQIQRQALKKSITEQLYNTQSPPLFSASQPYNNPPIYQTPMNKINNLTINPNQTELNNSHINKSIIQGFDLNKNQPLSSNKNSRISRLSGTENGLNLLSSAKNSLSPSRIKSPYDDSNNLHVYIKSPSQKSKSLQRSRSRSKSYSNSNRSSSRGINKSKSKEKTPLQEIAAKTFQLSPPINNKRSILQVLSNNEQLKSQIMNQSYHTFNSNNPQQYSPLSGINDTQLRQAIAASQAVRLANQNKLKQQKQRHYEHVTHRKRFDYTSDIYDDRIGKPYNHVGVLSRQTHFERTPTKVSTYDNYSTLQATITQKKQIVDKAISRLYPHSEYNNRETSPYKKNQKYYDSRYEQQTPLNRYGITREDQKKARLKQNQSSTKQYYGKDLKNSIFRNNATVKS